MEIKGKNITLRLWKESDASDLTKIADNQKISDCLRDAMPCPYTLADAKNWLLMAVKENMNYPHLFAIIYNNKLVGSIGFFVKDDVYRLNAEIGYFLSEEYWGKGLVSEAVTLVCKYVFSQYPVIRIYAEIFEPNLASRKVLEKNNFKLEAILKNNVIKKGNILNTTVYSILKENFIINE